jgi:hypothetical protein
MAATGETESIETMRDTERDRNIQGFLYDDFKFSVANRLGPDFAPKAEDVAAAMVGPLILPTPPLNLQILGSSP